MASFLLLLLYADNLDGDNTLDAKNAARLVTETIGPLLVGFTISAAYVLLSGAEILSLNTRGQALRSNLCTELPVFQATLARQYVAQIHRE